MTNRYTAEICDSAFCVIQIILMLPKKTIARNHICVGVLSCYFLTWRPKLLQLIGHGLAKLGQGMTNSSVCPTWPHEMPISCAPDRHTPNTRPNTLTCTQRHFHTHTHAKSTHHRHRPRQHQLQPRPEVRLLDVSWQSKRNYKTST